MEFNPALARSLCLNLAIALARAVAQDRQHYHHQHGHEHDNDRDLQRRKQETNEQDELFQESDHHEDQSDDCSESAKTFKNATTHNFNLVAKYRSGSAFEGKGSYVPARELSSLTSSKLGGVSRTRRIRNNRRWWTARIESDNPIRRFPAPDVIKQHVSTERNERHRQQLLNRQRNSQQRVQQEERADNDQRRAPGKRIAVKATRDHIVLSIRTQPCSHQLRGATSIDCRKQPRADNAKDKEVQSLSHYRHLEEAGEDREVNNRLRSLS